MTDIWNGLCGSGGTDRRNRSRRERRRTNDNDTDRGGKLFLTYFCLVPLPDVVFRHSTHFRRMPVAAVPRAAGGLISVMTDKDKK